MGSQQHAELVSEQEYLALEKSAQTKHEYVAGKIYAMTGASMNHERIVMNVLKTLGAHLENSPCDVFGSNLKVKTPTGTYRYPDCSVVCDESSDDEYVSHSPKVIVEVLSPTTRKADKQIKRLEYITIASLEEYVVIEQDTVEISVYRKNQHWQPTSYFIGDSVVLESIELSVPVVSLYHKVKNQEMLELSANNLP